MPTQIDVMDKHLTLSNEFSYQHAGGDDIFVAAQQGPYDMTDEKTIKEGDVLDSDGVLTVYSSGSAVLLQFSPEEDTPEPPKKAESKSTSSKSTSSESKSSSTKSSKK